MNTKTKLIITAIIIELIAATCIGHSLAQPTKEINMTKREYIKPTITDLSPECAVIHGQIQDMFDDGGTLEWRCSSCGRVFYPPTVEEPTQPA